MPVPSFARPATIHAVVSIHWILIAYVAAFGLIVGSYLNVVIYRLPRRLSTVMPRSRCPRCRAPIRAIDNIPVFSYLVLGGRCRRCGVEISWRYPAIEALTAICFVASLEWFGPNLEAVVAAGFCFVMIVLAMIDLEHFILPDVITLPGIVLGLALQFWIPWATWQEALVGAAIGAGVLLAVAWGWYWWKGIWGMGLGDVKMLAMIGAFLGWRGVVVTLFLSSLGGSLVGALLIVLGRMQLQSKLPFGVFLALAAILALFFGDATLDLWFEASAALLR